MNLGFYQEYDKRKHKDLKQYKIDYLKTIIVDDKLYKFIAFDDVYLNQIKLQGLKKGQLWFSYYKFLNDKTEFDMKFDASKVSYKTGVPCDNIKFFVSTMKELYDVCSLTYSYVDDMTFFSDSMETIYEKLPLIQRVLNKYRLRINSNKTESKNSIYNMSYVDMYELKNRFSFFDFEVTETITLDKDIFYNLKGYIAKKYDSGEKSEIKAILTLFKKAIDRGKLVMPEDSMIHLEQYISAYMLQLACTEPVFASRCYRVIISLLNLCEGKETYDEIIKEINAKNIHINATYQDSILQVWHYYVLSKYDSNINIERVIDAFASDEVNPIIIAGFIKEGFGNNKKLFDYIKRVYMAVENREGENSYWMRSIMFSKWWLPLMLIYVKDGKNYSSFYDSNHFHDFFKSMRIEPEQEQEQLVEQVAEEDDIFW